MSTAYYGPAAWREEVRAAKPSLARDPRIARSRCARQLAAIDVRKRIESLRLDYLRRQTDALIARAEMLRGTALHVR